MTIPESYWDKILATLGSQDLRDICRTNKLRGFSSIKGKQALIDFVKTSLDVTELIETIEHDGGNAIRREGEKAKGILFDLKPREALKSVKINSDNTELELFFQGFQWTVRTKIAYIFGEIGFECGCLIGKEGGYCAHMQIGYTAMVQMNICPPNSIGDPEVFFPAELAQYDYVNMKATTTDKVPASNATLFFDKKVVEFKSVDDALFRYYLNYADPTVKTISSLAKKPSEKRPDNPNFEGFLKFLNTEASGTKLQIATTLLNKFGEKALLQKYKEYTFQIRMQSADVYMVDLKEVDFARKLVVANVTKMNSHDIVIEGNKIEHHGDCKSWKYNKERHKFCRHLTAVFKALEIEHPIETLELLESLTQFTTFGGN